MCNIYVGDKIWYNDSFCIVIEIDGNKYWGFWENTKGRKDTSMKYITKKEITKVGYKNKTLSFFINE